VVGEAVQVVGDRAVHQAGDLLQVHHQAALLQAGAVAVDFSAVVLAVAVALVVVASPQVADFKRHVKNRLSQMGN